MRRLASSGIATALMLSAAALLLTEGVDAEPQTIRRLAQAEPVEAVVPGVKRERPSTPASEPAAEAPAQPSAPVEPYLSEPPDGYGGVIGSIRDWLARANRAYQGVIIRELSTGTGAGDDAIARKIEETKTPKAVSPVDTAADAAARAAADAKARADADAAAARAAQREAEADAERAKAEQAAREADEARRIAEAQAQAEARVAEQRRIVEEAERQKNASRKIVLTTEPIEPRRVIAQSEPRAAGSRESDAADSEFRDADRIVVAEAQYQPRIERARPSRRSAVRAWRQRSAAAQSCRRAGRAVTPPARYTVRRGDTLWRIAKRHYRSGRHYRTIYRANRQRLRNPNLIYPCQRVFVPRRKR